MIAKRSLTVRGMTCTGCEERITTALKTVPGVEDQCADHAAGTVTLTYDPAVADDEAACGAIEALGYRVVAR